MTLDQESQLLSLGLAAIEQIITAIKNAKSGALDPGTAISNITAMFDAIAANNATIDAEESKKFNP